MDLDQQKQQKNSIREAHTPQPGEIVFNTMKYRNNETVHRSRYSQDCQLYKALNNFPVEKITSKERKCM